MSKIRSLDMKRAGARNAEHTARPPARCKGDSGAGLVEFAIVAPILFLLLFAIIEFGWAFFQQLDIRHGGREAIRLYAVNSTPANSETTQVKKIAREVCNRMDVDNSGTDVGIVVDVDGSLVADGAGDTTVNDVGDQVTVTISKELDQLTGFLGPFLDDITLRSEVTTRLEQSATYTDLTAADDFTC